MYYYSKLDKIYLKECVKDLSLFGHIKKFKENVTHFISHLNKRASKSTFKGQTWVFAVSFALLMGLSQPSISSFKKALSEEYPLVVVSAMEASPKLNSEIIPLTITNYNDIKTPLTLKSDICSRDEGCSHTSKLISSITHPTLGKFFEKDIQCLAQNVYFESNNQSEDGMRATAEIVLSRMQDWRFPKQLCSVVYESNRVNRNGRMVTIYQFSWVGEGKKNIDYESLAWKQSLNAARTELSGKTKNLTKGALFYHADYVTPSWSKDKRLKKVAVVGDHIYYKFVVDGITFHTPMSEVRKLLQVEKIAKLESAKRKVASQALHVKKREASTIRHLS